VKRDFHAAQYDRVAGERAGVTKSNRRRALRLAACAIVLAGCSALPAPPAENVTVYMLDAQAVTSGAAVARNELVLAVGTPEARPGFDTPQIAYVRQPHELDYFVTARWAEAPARMLGPLLAQALEQAGVFRAVVAGPGAVPADLRLDTELVRLQHDFTTTPSRVQLTLRLQLTDLRAQRVLAVKLIEQTENASADNPYGGVVAANRALGRALGEIVEFCARAAAVR